MKIAIVTDVYWPRVNGLVVSIDAFKASLEILGHEVGVFTNRYNRYDQRDDRAKGRRNIHRFISMASPLYSKEDHVVAPQAWPAVYNALTYFRPDVVHVQTEFTIGQIGKFFARRNKIALVMSSHTHYEMYVKYVPIYPKVLAKIIARYFMWHCFRNATELIVPSQHFRDVMIRYGLRSRRLHVIPTGLDLRNFTCDPVDREIFLKEFRDQHPAFRNRRFLLFVGRIGQEKNIDLLLDVMDLVIAKQPDILLVMVGDGPYRHAFHRVVFRRNLQHHFLFTGFVDHFKLKYLYSQSRVFVFPSVSETQGLVTVEAMASGTPVVAVGEMGTYYVMQGDNGGFMVPNDYRHFADKVLLLLENPELREQKSQEALQYAKKWASDKMTSTLVGVYQSVITRNKC